MLNVLLPALAQQNTWDELLGSGGVIVGIGLALLFAFSFMLMLVTRYRRCPSNKILVIYGKVAKGESSRCLHGGGSFVWPLIQAYDYLDLEPIQIEVPLKGALSAENIRVNVPSYFTVAIGTQTGVMQNAAIRLLGLSTEQIKNQALDIIFGQLRQVIASMPIEAINKDRDVFLKNIQHSLEPELEKIGLVLINVNITDITDESGYIEALGRKAASEAIQQAEIDVAEQTKKGAIGVAAAERDREIEVAQATKLREIGTKDAEREMAVRVAELAKERSIGEQRAGFEREAQVKDAEQQMRVQIAKANALAVAGEKDAQREMAVRVAELAKLQEIGEQTASFEREAQVREAERAMRIQVAKANADAVAGENLSKAQIVASEAELKVKAAESYAVGETRKRQAEAEVLAAQYRAEAVAAESNAKKIEAEQRAALEAPARAQRARVVVEAEAEADRVKIEAAARATAVQLQAEGDAKALYARLEAQARGEFEILAKKAEGLRKLVEGCGGANQAFQLLMLEHLDHLAETSAKAISNIKFDKVTVWDSGGAGKGGAAGFLSSLGQAVPPLMNVMKSVGGVELPEYLGKLAASDDVSASAPPTKARDGAK
ncbi:MAG: flotillin family protein [Planctomycetes bacterium]|nr:flotillin family protein [Planctomycetota bacterium]